MTRPFFKSAATAVLFSMLPFAALAGDIEISDAYVRTASPNAKTGAAFFGIINHGTRDDRLIAAKSEIANKVELHTHIMEDGVARMREIEGGIAVPAGEMHLLERGGDHVMFMGMRQSLDDGELVTVTLVFEEAGEVVLEIPVDRNRKPKATMAH